METARQSNEVPERFIPDEMHGLLVEAEHMLRYWWASTFSSGSCVLDAGCGVGYGSAMLQHGGAASVMGVDLSEAAVAIASDAAPGGVSYQVADITALPFEDDSFDLVVCFEAIEHVDDPDAALDELARVCAPEGMLLISSPNRDRYVPGNPHHRHEYVPSEFRTVLERRFPTVRLLCQHVMIASVLTYEDSGAGLEGAEVRREVAPEPGGEIYTVAMAGKSLPSPGPAVISLTSFVELRQWLEYYDRQAQTLKEQRVALQEMEAIRDDRREALSLLAKREQQLASASLTSSRDFEEDLEAQLKGARQAIADIQGSISWRITSPLRGAKRILRGSSR